MLLNFFPKCFSSFLHSTCVLSVLEQYLALEHTYAPFCTPRPKCATRSLDSVCTCFSAWTGFSPSMILFSKKSYAGNSTGDPTKDYNPLQAMVSILSPSLFSRPYWGNHVHFLFLHLLICLNSVRCLAWAHAKRRILILKWGQTLYTKHIPQVSSMQN